MSEGLTTLLYLSHSQAITYKHIQGRRMSCPLDFHPKKTDRFYFSDNDNEIRYFTINPFSCTRISKFSELWNITKKKSMKIPTHENIISALAQSPITRMVAFASHGSSVKL
ncbi:hypothetical protein JCGZ_09334 [Jatropha curcas]|uniref:Uncharacterized protein n=1 Tax=Jatropha curcas TaxID=180498 RepID=A0A067KNB3_JATCU|nr:hypothetical protein JCGZ_09334 [Jatropha curcas]